MFQKRHYEAFAFMLAERKTDTDAMPGAAMAEKMRQSLAYDLVAMFERDNPRFRRAQFLDRALVPYTADDVAAEPQPESRSWQSETFSPGRDKRRPWKPLKEGGNRNLSKSKHLIP